MKTYKIVPILDEEFAGSLAQGSIALYKTDSTGVINVGRPDLQAYVPMAANMYGFNDAVDKGYYMVLKEDEIVYDRAVYYITVSDEYTVVTTIKLNSVESYDMLGQYLTDEVKKTMK